MSQSTPETENASTETDKAGPERENPAKDAEFGEVTDEMLPEDVRPGTTTRWPRTRATRTTGKAASASAPTAHRARRPRGSG